MRGDVVEIFPAESSEKAIRVEFFGDEIERISEVVPLTGEIINDLKHVAIYPRRITSSRAKKWRSRSREIEAEMEERVKFFKSEDKLIEAQRIEQRTRYDIEMLSEIGMCKGIENYSRVLFGP